MKIVQADQLTFVRGLEHRGGTFHSIIMMEGETGSIGNFQVSYGRIGGDFFSPRHRHNFEQIRFQVEGALDFARDGKLEEGMIGYFPEGVAYGPQTQSAGADVATVVLQFGGASGSGYLSQDEVRAGVAALRQEGEFKDGVFRRRADVPGKRNVDGYQAIWEHVNGRAMKYPEARYSRPFMMNPEHYSWVPLEQAAGVSEKQLGTFTERRSGAAFIKFATGARHYAFGRAVFVVLSGAGRAGDHPLRRLTTLYLDRGERLNIEAHEAMQVLQLGLPNLAGLQQRVAAAPAMAAE
jgi:hypothetical protein